MIKIGVVDTTFARVNMGSIAVNEIKNKLPNAKVIRYTVPGIKDIPVAAKKLIEEEGCGAVITLGWVGPTLTDKLSYTVASMGIIMVQLMTNKHIIDVTVHEDEAKSEEELYLIAVDRTKKHVQNLITLIVRGKEGLTPYAGMGLRQGKPDVGPLKQ